MLTRPLASLIFAAATLLFATFTVSAADAPPWLRQAAQAPIPAYENDVDAVVLYREESVSLEGNGNLVTTERYAVKVLTRDGRRDAVGVAFYLSNFGKVRDIAGWLIAPGGTVRAYGKKDVIDRISDTDDVYDEGRVKIIDASRDADVGYVFGYTVTSEEKPLFFQSRWAFQDNHPTLTSRFSLMLPSGWKATSITFNRDQVAPSVTGNSYTWELRNLPPIKYEPMSPSFANLAPRIAVDFAPDGNTQAAGPVFKDWADVSRWTSTLYEPQVIIDDAVAQKARDLTANAKSELEIIRAIGTYVQNLQYISIDIGVGHGNGLKPRASNLVLARGYGDCKDKANLMRALLRSLKIEAYPIAIYSGDPNFVRKEWPSPGQFNHCIIAVRVSAATNSPTIINHAKLGRLMIFDATDQFTPVGDLPESLQGSHALLIAGNDGGLIQMPVTAPEFNAWNRETQVTLSPTGGIDGTIRESATGQESRNARTYFRSVSSNDFSKAIEAWLASGAGASTISKLTPRDRQADAAFEMDVEFSAPRYAQIMQGRLMVFKPTIANRSNSIYLTEKTRQHPVMLESNSFQENVVFTLPNGFTVDEMPTAVSYQTDFGKYSTAYEVKENKLYFKRSMVITRAMVPVDRYASVRDFFTKIRDAEQTPVVLIRK